MHKYSIILILAFFVVSCEDDSNSPTTGTISINFSSPIDLRMSNCYFVSVWEFVNPPEVEPFYRSNGMRDQCDGFNPTEIQNVPTGKYTIKWNHCSSDNYYPTYDTEAKYLNEGETISFNCKYLEGPSFNDYYNPEEWQNGKYYEVVWNPGELGNIDLYLKVGHWANASQYKTVISKDTKNTGSCTVKVPNDLLEGRYNITLTSDTYELGAEQKVSISGGLSHIDELDFIYDDGSFETNTGYKYWTNNGDIIAMKVPMPSDWIRLSMGVIKTYIDKYASNYEIVILDNVEYSPDNIIQSRLQSVSSTGWTNNFAYGNSYLASDFNNGYLLVGIKFLNDISEPYIGIDNNSTISNNFYFYNYSENSWSQIRDGNVGIRVHLIRDE